MSAVTSAFSFGAWVKFQGAVTFPNIIGLWGGSGTSTGANIYQALTTGVLNFKGHIGGTAYDSAIIPAGGSAPHDTWYHVAATYDGTTVRGYLNGQICISFATVGGAVDVTDQSIDIGNRGGSGGTGFWQGCIQQAFVGPYMTAVQVQNIYQNGVYPSGMVGIWPLNEGAGTTAYDVSGNGNNATLTAGVYALDSPIVARGQVGGNMIYNGNFEIAPPSNTTMLLAGGGNYYDGTSTGVANKSLFGWGLFNYTGTIGVLFDNSVSHSGNWSLKLSTTATASTVGMATFVNNAAGIRIAGIPVLPGTSYTLSGWITTTAHSGSASSGAQLILWETNGSAGTVKSNNVISGITTSTGWTYYSKSFVTQNSTTYVAIRCNVIGNDGTSTLIMDAWFDDLTLVPTPGVITSAVSSRALIS